MQIDSKLYEWETIQEIFKDEIIPCSFGSHHKVGNLQQQSSEELDNHISNVIFLVKVLLLYFLFAGIDRFGIIITKIILNKKKKFVTKLNRFSCFIYVFITILNKESLFRMKN